MDILERVEEDKARAYSRDVLIIENVHSSLLMRTVLHNKMQPIKIKFVNKFEHQEIEIHCTTYFLVNIVHLRRGEAAR